MSQNVVGSILRLSHLGTSKAQQKNDHHMCIIRRIHQVQQQCRRNFVESASIRGGTSNCNTERSTLIGRESSEKDAMELIQVDHE